MFDWAKSSNVRNSYTTLKVCLNDIDMPHVIGLNIKNSK